MAHTSTRTGLTSRAARAGLATLLLAGGVGAAQAAQGVTAHAAQPRLAAGSPKPDWRGADLGNSGDEAVNGPATTPAQVFNANPGQGAGTIQGIELDGAGNVLFTKGDGFVYSYTPAGTQNFVVNTGSSFGADTNGAASNPVASADGNIYISTDQGNLLKINAATGVSTQFVNYGAKVQQTLKVDDATNNVFFGGQDHFINSFSKTGASNYSTTATGSTQDGTLAGCSGAVSANALFYGEGALDANDNFYVGSLEPKTSGPRSCSNPTFGTLYKVSPTGAILANKPLAGADVSAVALVPNAAVAGGSELVVDTKLGYVEAFDTSLNRLYAVKIANASLNASPVVDAARNRVYVADTASALHALNLTTGAADTTFNPSGTGAPAPGQTGLTGGTQSSPILDGAGNVYAVDSTGTLFSFDPNGATRYSFNTNIGTGFFSPAIATDGTIYVGGNVGQASGFNAAAVTTPTVAATGTTTPTVAANTATNTAVANTATNTAVANTATNTAAANTATNTAAANTATNTAAANTATNTAAANTATNTAAANTATNTAVPATATSTNTSTTVGNTATNTAAANTATNTAAANTATNTAVPATATSTRTATNTAVANTATTAATNTTAPTSTPTNTATTTSTATNTSTPNATATAQQQTVIAQTATAQATQGVNLPNCQLYVLPNPKIVQRTGSEAVLFKVLPNAPITVTIGASYVTTATLYTGAAGTPGVTINRNPDGTFTFIAGPNGRALIDFPIPANAPLGPVTVKAVATENCNGGDAGQSNKTQPHTITRTSSFTVEAAQAGSFGLHETQSRHRILFRTVQPTGAGSVVTDTIYIHTAPNVPVTTTFTLSAPAANVGSAYTNGQQVYQNVSTSSSNGSVKLKAPFSSTLLVPGKGGRLLETVQANIDGTVVTFRSQKALREVSLRLLAQVQETTRGNRRAPFEISNRANGSSKLTVLVLCDPNASISGVANVGSFSNTQTATCGAGGRAKLKYSVPNSTTPAKGTGTVTVTSSYRGATKTRSVSFHYTHKPGTRA